MKECSIPNCGRKAVAKGLCNAHWQRQCKLGDVQAGRPIGDKSGSNNPRWKGGVISGPVGRIVVFKPDHPHCSTTGYVLRYRLVMEKIIGRFLKPSELVHHKNGNTVDDRPETLKSLRGQTI